MSIDQEIYQQIDNQLYDRSAEHWWAEDSDMLLLKDTVNPVRVPFFREIIDNNITKERSSLGALEVGCGGGYLTEEIARMGFSTIGIDPSEAVLQAARSHAAQKNLTITYTKGRGEALPFPDQSFELVFCCDVLEHVEFLDETIREISRVLKPGGLFFFDTINRTLASKLVMINIFQQWKWFAFMPPQLHVWEMFIKPGELKALMKANDLSPQTFFGMSPKGNVVYTLTQIRKYKLGKISFKQLASSMVLKRSNNLLISYMGFAEKK